ncbi:M56 family metallopeptidase [Phocaeicola sp.]|uniref:M56 family metallopeptidase n=1 Tax=Phocaeicola sp. TaxID=2773926 RepID=UPI0023C4639E|nr:M56 family metallopeptidase [Phocaeicola sp.]MDE5677237.1 M56 family metallopeptidase [Phocaeicola sp.]
MVTFLTYILKSSFCLSLFYVFYRIWFRGTTHFRFNRRVLLGGMAVCLLLPLTRITLDEELPVHRSLRMLDEALITLSLPEADHIVADADKVVSGENAPVGIRKMFCLLPAVYGGGCVVVFFSFLMAYVRMWRLMKEADVRKDGKVTWLVTDGKINPFSWGRYIVMNRDDYVERPLIRLHERMHVCHRHSWDNFFMQLLQIFHWFNPVVWLWRKELYDLHEYQVDREVLNQGIDAKIYQLLLVKKAVGARLYSMASGFNHCSIKKRIVMMKKRKTPRWKRLYLLLAFPVVAGVIFVFARPEVNDTLQMVVARQVAVSDTNLVDLSVSAADYQVFADECVAFDLFVNQHNQMLFGVSSIMDKVTPDDMAGIISKRLASVFVSCYDKNGEVPEIVVRITADRNSKMGFVFDAKHRVICAYEQALMKLAGKYPSELLRRSLAARVSYEEPRAYAKPVPAGVYDKNLRLGEGIRVALFSGEKQRAELAEFTLQELEEVLAGIDCSRDELTVGLRLSKDTPEGVLHDIKQVLRKYLLKVDIVH